MKKTFKIGVLVFLAAYLIGCAVPGSAIPVTGPAVTLLPGTTASSTAQPENLPTATAPDPGIPESTVTPGSERTVTLADNGTTITLQAGDHFVLKLGEIYNWEVVSSDPAVVSRVMNIMAVRGSQGIYTAHKAGQVDLTAQGDPLCRASKPACMLPSIAFKVSIVVK